MGGTSMPRTRRVAISSSGVNGTLWAVPFDPDRLEVTGEIPIPGAGRGAEPHRVVRNGGAAITSPLPRRARWSI